MALLNVVFLLFLVDHEWIQHKNDPLREKKYKEKKRKTGGVFLRGRGLTKTRDGEACGIGGGGG